ncbi:HNH endonuclease signature motif containing protein [Aeromicrobium sp.]|uniref:HNH endonuclease signature motif containing protein n=1 Tax=Aeromicrobium sp. TaxID=1871063 RepID=UPI002FC62FF5
METKDSSVKLYVRGMSAAERILWRCYEDSESGCWVWTGDPGCPRYGQMRIGGAGSRKEATHRLVYAALRGPIPDGLVINHLCFNIRCVNPGHLEAVTARENVLYGRHNGWHGRAACLHGHTYTDENTRVDPKSGARKCKTCDRNRAQEYRDRKRAA